MEILEINSDGSKTLLDLNAEGSNL